MDTIPMGMAMGTVTPILPKRKIKVGDIIRNSVINQKLHLISYLFHFRMIEWNEWIDKPELSCLVMFGWGIRGYLVFHFFAS